MSHRNEPVGDDVAKRLARITGHAASLQRFWDDGRECVDMLTQIAAVRGALEQVSKEILNHHIDHCVGAVIDEDRRDQAVKDLKTAISRLM